MEIEFPPELLAACGRHGIGVYLISNDISAAEVLAARQSPSSTSPPDAAGFLFGPNVNIRP